MKKIYAVLSYIITPFILLRFWLKSYHSSAYRQRLKERLALFPKPPEPVILWIHAVSLGEVIAAAPLVQRLQKQYPDHKILLTTTTPTGSQKALAAFGDSLLHVYAPLDQPAIIRRFLRKIQPKAVIMMETELWPNWFFACQKNNIPIIIANARLSEKSQKGYRRIAPLIRSTLNCIEKLLAQTSEDARRFIQLGLASEKVIVAGNIKFDLTIPEDIYEQGKKFRAIWGTQRPVWIAASTHNGEDEIILEAFKTIKKDYPDSVLILVPRHPERFDKAAELAEKAGFSTVLRTHLTASANSSSQYEKMDVLIGNTIGEMFLFLTAADAVFIGGSLIPQGGHNLLEPAALYVPILTGPNMFNFQKIYDDFTQNDSIITVYDADSIAEAIKNFFTDPALCEEYACRAFEIIKKNQGALEKHLKVIQTYTRDL